jgi:hypothetical protein
MRNNDTSYKINTVHTLQKIIETGENPWILFENGTFVFLNDRINLEIYAVMLISNKRDHTYKSNIKIFHDCWILDTERNDVFVIIPKSEFGPDCSFPLLMILAKQIRKKDRREKKIIHIEN